MLNLSTLLPLVLVSFGLAYIITGSVIAIPLRLGWCWLTKRWRSLWYLVQCPPCCSFWCGVVVGALTRSGVLGTLQVAITTCGLTALAQAALGGDGIAANEDFEELFKGKESEEDVEEGSSTEG